MPAPTSSTLLTAYDYDRQIWVQGEEARPVRRTQLLIELEILNSSRAVEYLRFLGSDHSVSEAVKKASEELAALG